MFFKNSSTTVVTAHVSTYVTNTVYVNKFLIHFFMFLRHHTLSTHEFWLLDLLQRSNNNDLQCSELVFRYKLCFGLFCFCSLVHVGTRMDPNYCFTHCNYPEVIWIVDHFDMAQRISTAYNSRCPSPTLARVVWGPSVTI